MTPPTYVYVLIWDDKKGDGLKTYTGITYDIEMRIKQHISLKGGQTTKKFMKKFGKPISIRFTKVTDKMYEKTFKKYSMWKKLNISRNWDRWAV